MRNPLVIACWIALGALTARSAEVASSSAAFAYVPAGAAAASDGAGFSYVPTGNAVASSVSPGFPYCPSGAALAESSSAPFSFGEEAPPRDIDLGNGMNARNMMNGTFIVSGSGVLTADLTASLKALGVTNLVIGAGVTGVGDGAFSGWRSIRVVTVGADCAMIGANAFGKCYNLTNVTCAATGITLGDYAFLRCNSLQAITFVDMPTYQKTPFAFHSAICMRDGMPEVFAVPQITIGGYEQVLLGKTNLTDEVWCEVKDESTRAGCHFFKIELRK